MIAARGRDDAAGQRLAGSAASSRLVAPRALNEPVTCRHSSYEPQRRCGRCLQQLIGADQRGTPDMATDPVGGSLDVVQLGHRKAPAIGRGDDQAAIAGPHPAGLAPSIDDAVGAVAQLGRGAARIVQEMDAPGWLPGLHLRAVAVIRLEHSVIAGQHIGGRARHVIDLGVRAAPAQRRTGRARRDGPAPLRTPRRQMSSASSDTVPARAISVPTTVSPAATAAAVAVRGSPRLSTTTVIGAPKASTASMLRRCCAGSAAGSTIALGRIVERRAAGMEVEEGMSARQENILHIGRDLPGRWCRPGRPGRCG